MNFVINVAVVVVVVAAAEIVAPLLPSRRHHQDTDTDTDPPTPPAGKNPINPSIIIESRCEIELIWISLNLDRILNEWGAANMSRH